MSIGATPTDIANLALILIGEQPIMSIDTPTDKQGRTCKAMFEFAKRAAFTAHPWGCLVKRELLPKTGSTPKFEFENEYRLPSDCLRLFQIIDPLTGQTTNETFKVEGDTILTNMGAPLQIRYIKDTSDFSSLPPHVYDVLVHTLALRITLPITAKSTIYNAMKNTLKELLDEASFTDSTVDTPDQPKNADEFGDARE
jgi:hypothetical protein